MTKISFDVDFSKDPEKILQEIQERARAEVEKRESKERNAAYLSKLYEQVNEKLGTDYKSVSDLIRALAPFAAPSLREKLSGTTASGRRKTISMNKETFDEVKKLLDKPNPNKAAIARETGVSVVQVRKVADGGFDEKFGGAAASVQEKPAMPSIQEIAPPKMETKPEEEKNELDPLSIDSKKNAKELPPIDDDSKEDSIKDDSPPLPSFGDSEESTELPPIDLTPPPPTPDLPPSPAAEDDSPLENKEVQDDGEANILPPLPKFTPVPFDSTEENESEDTPAPLPSFGDETDAPLAPADLSTPPPAPDLPSPVPANSENSSVESEGNQEESADILPPLPKFTPAPFDDTSDAPADSISDKPPPPLPSFGDEESATPPPPPPPSLSAADSTPPMPDLPPPVPVAEEDSSEAPEEETTPPVPPAPPEPPAPDAQAEDPVPPAPPPVAPTGGLTRPPSGLKPTLKPKLSAGKKGKPSLSLKPKSKTTGLKITRPPMRGNPPPS